MNREERYRVRKTLSRAVDANSRSFSHAPQFEVLGSLTVAS